MTSINAAAISGGVLAALMMVGMLGTQVLPIWPLVIAWGCFFHADGATNPNRAWIDTVCGTWLGAVAGWITALLILANSFLPLPLWAGIVVGVTILAFGFAAYVHLFRATSILVYGFAANWAFLDMPEHFNGPALWSVSLQNVLVSVLPALVLGASFGWVQSFSVRLLTRANSIGPALSEQG